MNFVKLMMFLSQHSARTLRTYVGSTSNFPPNRPRKIIANGQGSFCNEAVGVSPDVLRAGGRVASMDVSNTRTA